MLNRITPLVVLLALFQFWAAGQSGGRDGPVDIVILLILVFAVVVGDVFRMTTVIRLTPEMMAIGSWLTPKRLVPRSDIRGVALRRYTSYPSRASFGVAVVYGESGRRFATLPESVWDDADLYRLQAALGSNNHVYREVTRDEYQREFPGALRNYWGWLLAGVVLVVIFSEAVIQTR